MIRSLPLFLLFLLASSRQTAGYSPGNPWPAGSDVVMHLGLGPTTVALQDGMANWNASAADAVDIWNGYLDFISFSSVSASTVPQVSGDGVNSVFFSKTIFGDSFGVDTLAATVGLYAPGPVIVETTEADVVVNPAFQFDSYRGPLQTARDFHRVVLHEFGHVLGLEHTTFEPPGQALMEPIISDLDHLGADDVAGVQSFYGAKTLSLPAAVTLRVGDSYSADSYTYNNNPTSYSATGLPPGITVDSVTGQINGVATTDGSYGPVITAHGPIADAYGTFPMTILGLEEVPGLLSILRGTGSPFLADPIRPRIYTAGQTGIDMIDTETLAVTNLVPADSRAAFFPSISADGSILLYTNANSLVPQELRIDLASLKALPPIDIPGNRNAVLEGLNNQAYVAGYNSIYQFDATTGQLQQEFAIYTSSSDTFLSVAMSMDRQTLFVARAGLNGEVSCYDISTAVPVLTQQLIGSFSHPTPSPDGKFLYCIADEYGFQSQSVVQVPLPSLSPTKSFGSDFFISSIAVNLDGSIYESHSPFNFSTGVMSIYDAKSLLLTSEIDPAALTTDFPFQATGGVFDNSGKDFFMSVSSLWRDMGVFNRPGVLSASCSRDEKPAQYLNPRSGGDRRERDDRGFHCSRSRSKKAIDPRARSLFAADWRPRQSSFGFV
jgi:hypothetical protein